jgi:curved DNA-binding protein CbpA
LREQSHYEVLGVDRAATAEEIKRRFRELARKHHPDVARGDSAETFILINEAYQTLSNPRLRALYDSTIKLREMQARNAEARSAGSPETHRPTPPPPPRPRQTATRDKADAHHFRAAELFRRMRLREAELACKEAIRLDRANPALFELLGDIYKARGRDEEALAMYSYALQLDRTRGSVREKIARMTGERAGPIFGARARGSDRRRRGPSIVMLPVRLGATFAAMAGIGWLASLVAALPGPAASVWLFDWDETLLLALTASGLLLGVVLSLDGVLGSARQELGGPRALSSGHSSPVGILLILFGMIFFYAAVAVYWILSILENHVSPSVLITFAGACGLILLFATMAGDGAANVILLGGNILFPSLLVGWRIGDAVRSTV